MIWNTLTFGTIPAPSQAALNILKELRKMLENTQFIISKQIVWTELST